MSGADDLRTALPTCWYCPECRGVWRYEPDYTEHDDCDDEGTPIVVSLIPPSAAADPVRRLAILSLVGDTARCLACPRCGEPFRAPHAGPMPMEYDPGAYTSSEKSCPCCTRPPFGEPAFVVRPRGEATDA